MQLVKGLLIGASGVAIFLGLLWIGQGTGIVHWPAASPMIHHIGWAYRGIALLAGGAIVMILSLRM